jgi:hypothetical protein
MPRPDTYQSLILTASIIVANPGMLSKSLVVDLYLSSARNLSLAISRWLETHVIQLSFSAICQVMLILLVVARNKLQGSYG